GGTRRPLPVWGSRAIEALVPAAAPARPPTGQRTGPAPGRRHGSSCSSPSSTATAPGATTAPCGTATAATAALRRRPLLLSMAALGFAVHLLATVHTGQSVGAAAAGSARRPLDIPGPTSTTGTARAAGAHG